MSRKTFSIASALLLVVSHAVAGNEQPETGGVPIQYVRIAQKHSLNAVSLYQDAIALSGHRAEFATTTIPWPFSLRTCSDTHCEVIRHAGRQALYVHARRALDQHKQIALGPLLVNWDLIAATVGNNLWLATDPLVSINTYATQKANGGTAKSIKPATETKTLASSGLPSREPIPSKTRDPILTDPVSNVFDSDDPISRREIDRLVERLSSEYGADPELVKSIIQNESNYDPNAVSRAGAVGLMQLMPSTGKAYGVASDERHIPHKNIRGGIAYLSDLKRKYKGDLFLMLAAYNAGETAIQKHGNRIPPYTETVQYVVRVLRTYLSALESRT